MITLDIEGKRVDICPAKSPDKPVVYINTFMREVNAIYKIFQKGDSPDFSLVAITNLDWNHDMAPWDCPPINKHDTPCSKGADDYLKILTDKIMPEAEKSIPGKPSWRGISGYSMAGLFAVYSLYRTDLFSRAASMSGSLWFPGLTDYIFSHDMAIRPDHVYFSLGDKESKTKNQYLCTTQDNTDKIQKYYEKQGIDSIFVLNPGNHYINPEKRTAAGIDWILKR